jgi:hypothetical protein
VDHVADGVYPGLKDSPNSRNFAGLNFDEPEQGGPAEVIFTASARDLVLSPTILRHEFVTFTQLATGYPRHIAAPYETGREGS